MCLFITKPNPVEGFATLAFRYLLCIVVCCALTSCTKSTQENCDEPFSIGSVSPDSNPPGYEILIQGTGYASDMEVRFGNERADIREVSFHSFIATVPSGLLGPVEITVSNGDCLSRFDFEVLSGFPPGVPPSPTTILIPPGGFSIPAPIANNWTNIADSNHTICLTQPNDNQFGGSSRECHLTDPLLAGNRIEGDFSYAPFYSVRIAIERDLGTELYDGVEIDPSLVGSTDDMAMLLISRKDGRQLVITTSGNGTMDCNQEGCD